jgi:AcrR family transcriptional regulator
MKAENTGPRVAKSTQRPGRPAKNHRRRDIREKLLDVAEQLFAEEGFHVVTMQQIAQSASVTKALLHYYFEDKRGLLSAVFARRAEYIDRLQKRALERYEKKAQGRMTLDGIIRANMRVAFRIVGSGKRLRNFTALQAQLNNTPGWGTAIMADFNPGIQRIASLIQKVYPNVPIEDIYWGMLQFSGALGLTMARTGRIDQWSNGSCRSDDLQAARPRVVAYAIGGLGAICENAQR